MPMNRNRISRTVYVGSPAHRGQAAGGALSGGDRLAAKLARGSAAAALIYVFAGGLTYGAQFVLAKTIGSDGYGIYAYVFAWVTVLAYVSALGFDVSLLRFVAAYLATENFALLRGVARYAVRRVTVFGCIIAAAGAGLLLLHFIGLRRELFDTFLVGFAVVPVLALLWVHAAIVRGLGGVATALLPDRLVRDGVLLILVAGAGAFWQIGPRSAMAATLLGAAAGLGLAKLAMERLRPIAARAGAAAYQPRSWRGTMLPLVIIGSTEALMNRTGIVLLGWLVGTKEAGIYALAFNIAFAAMLPRTAVNTLLAPVIARLFVRNERAALRAVVAEAAVWTLLGAACIALPVLLFAEPLLGLFGRDFVAGATALRILMISQLLAAAAGSQLHLLNMTGHERSAAALLLASAAFNAALAFVLVGPLHATGAAIAAALALIAWNAAMSLSIWRYLDLLPGLFATWPDRDTGCRPLGRLGRKTRRVSCRQL